MRLCVEKRMRLVVLFELNYLHLVPKRFDKLRELAENENIFISKRGATNLIKMCRNYNTVNDLNLSSKRRLLISEYQLAIIDRAVYRNREFTGRALKLIYKN